VDARDVGLAIALAVETVDRRASFNIAGSEITTESALRQIAAHIPKAKLLVAPLWLAVGVGSLLDLKVRLFGGFNPMPPNGLRFTAERLHVDTTRSIQELGMTYRPFAETARDVAQYWIRRCA